MYIGADLPASDDNGLLDPYLKVGYRDQAKQLTHKLQATRDPVWNQSFDFGTILSEDLSVAPPVSITAVDHAVVVVVLCILFECEAFPFFNLTKKIFAILCIVFPCQIHFIHH